MVDKLGKFKCWFLPKFMTKTINKYAQYKHRKVAATFAT